MLVSERFTGLNEGRQGVEVSDVKIGTYVLYRCHRLKSAGVTVKNLQILNDGRLQLPQTVFVCHSEYLKNHRLVLLQRNFSCVYVSVR